MLRRGVITVVVMLAALVSSHAQQRTLPSRQQIDSMMEARLTPTTNNIFAVDSHTIHLGTVEAGATTTAKCTLRNTTPRKVAITRVESTCGCLGASVDSSVLDPNESTTLSIAFNSTGRGGDVKYDILVYSSEAERCPSLRLTVVATIKCGDSWSHLKKSMGALRISRREVVLDNITANKRRTERIAIANPTSGAVRLSARSTIEGLTFSTSPEVLQSGEEGDIVISYLAATPLTSPVETFIVVEGITATPAERIIRITLRPAERK